MSKLVPDLQCGLCSRPIDPLKPHFRASGDFLPKGDALTRYCNAAMHWPCYAEWPERSRFAQHYVDAWVAANRNNPFWWFVYRDEHVYISANPQKPVEEASVRLYAAGSDIRLPLPRWSEWLRKCERVTPGLSEFELAELRKVLPTLRAQFPDDHAVVDAIDPDEKRGGGRSRRGMASAGRRG